MNKKDSISSFYCRCRHAGISKYFDDQPPFCNKLCDVCKQPTEVKKSIEMFKVNRFLIRTEHLVTNRAK
jgi:hypothetical protein